MNTASLKSISLFIISVVLSSSCAMTAQQVDFKPQVSPRAKLFAHGQKVGITVIDERPRDVIGYRGVGRFGAAITGKQDLSSVIRSTLQESLTNWALPVRLHHRPERNYGLKFAASSSVIPGLFAGNVEAAAFKS
jgi:uncharacterized lipoprotein YajG